MTRIISTLCVIFFALMLGMTSASAQNMSTAYRGNPEVGGQWHGFASPQYYLGQGGRQPSLQQVAGDLQRADPQVFRSHYARTQFVRLLGAKVGRAMSAAEIAGLIVSNQVRVVSCGGQFSSAAYNTAGAIRWITRSCYAGEQFVEVLVNGTWTLWFSLGCLNPMDGQAGATNLADPCPNVWVNPRGPATGRQQMLVFVPADALHCLPPSLRCAQDCEDWAWGRRGQPESRAIADSLYAIVRGGGRAFYLDPGMTGVNLPASMSVHPIWCERGYHRSQQAEFMEIRRR